MKAYQAQAERALESNDTLAWMIGSYVARGFHDPRKYPRKPVFATKKQTTTMTDSDMKNAMREFAERHNREVNAGAHNP